MANDNNSGNKKSKLVKTIDSAINDDELEHKVSNHLENIKTGVNDAKRMSKEKVFITYMSLFMLAMAVFYVSADKITKHNRNRQPELAIIDSIYYVQKDSLDNARLAAFDSLIKAQGQERIRMNNFFEKQEDSLKKAYEFKVNSVKQTYKENFGK